MCKIQNKNFYKNKEKKKAKKSGISFLFLCSFSSIDIFISLFFLYKIQGIIPQTEVSTLQAQFLSLTLPSFHKITIFSVCVISTPCKAHHQTINSHNKHRPRKFPKELKKLSHTEREGESEQTFV